MSSCSCIEICPQCGNETLVLDFDLNTEESDGFCEFCGYKHSHHIKKDENENFEYRVEEYPISKIHIGTVSYLDGIAKPILPLTEIKDLSKQKILDIFNRKNMRGFFEQTNANNLLFVSSLQVEVLLSPNCKFEITDDKLIVYTLLFDETTVNTFGHILACDGEIIYQENFSEIMSKDDALEIVKQKLSVENVEWVFASWFNNDTKKYEILFESRPGIIL